MSNKVIHIKDAKKKATDPTIEIEGQYNFENAIKANEARDKRLAAERQKANESVKRSYKLKPKKDT